MTGEVYQTNTRQQRFILGHTPNGDVAFATKGSNPGSNYNNCQIQSQADFRSDCPNPPLYTSNSATIQSVLSKFANYITANRIS